MVSNAKASLQRPQIRTATLIYSAFIAGLCSIIYELLIATTASYFLGNSVKYFSLTIGIYMAAMGLGSFVSKYIHDGLLQKFVIAELCLGLCGGLCIPLLYFAYAYTDLFLPLYFGFTMIIGFLIGLEIPFLTRLMDDYHNLKSNIANILSFDYLGALIATVSFPFLLLPLVGVYQSSLLFGLVNMSIGFAVLNVFEKDIPGAKLLKSFFILGTLVLIGMIILSGAALRHWDQSLYQDRVVFSDQTPYQKIVMTQYKQDLRLFLDGNLQFSSIDEHRYHEALVHVPLAAHNPALNTQLEPQQLTVSRAPKRVLLLGAGDGLAARELLKYPSIETIVVVDLDPKMVELATTHPAMLALNQSSLLSNKVQVLHQDAFAFLRENQAPFDFIISDLPDPNNDVLARLYSTHFYHLIQHNLAAHGVFVTQATSPYFATNAFWSIVKTMQATGLQTQPFQVQIPSFGDWGFVMATKSKAKNSLDEAEIPVAASYNSQSITIPTRYLENALVPQLFYFEKDIQPTQTIINRMDQPMLLSYYLNGWQHYAR